MTSTFAWLDFSERDRKHALDIVDLFREDDTRDELGIGVIRDAIADQLFPGTSTVQTRLRYFLFVPWIFGNISSRSDTADRVLARSRELQDQLRRALLAGGETSGVIGQRAGRDVKRLPSNIYWLGLRRWGLLRFAGSEYDYARRLVRRPSVEALIRNDDGEPTGDGADDLWDPHLPAPPTDWLKSTTFRLSGDEADYLVHRIRMAADHSLLEYLIHLEFDPGDQSAPWEVLSLSDLPAKLAEELTHARNFSVSMRGAALLYNLMLAEEKRRDDWVTDYRTAIAEWWQERRSLSADLAAWDRTRFWQLLSLWRARVTIPTRNYVEDWIGLSGGMADANALTSSTPARDLTADRERYLKGPRARLGNPRALDLWTGHSGTAPLTYRWNSPVRDVLLDLLTARRHEA